MSEYGEPWSKKFTTTGVGYWVNRKNAHQAPLPDEIEDRQFICMNACAGIPTAALEAGAVQSAIKALQAMERCPGYHTTDQETGETFATAAQAALRELAAESKEAR